MAEVFRGPAMPIGYIEPLDGKPVALGLAMAIGPWEPPARSLAAAVVGGAQLSPMPFTGPGSGVIVTGFGQGQFPRLGAPLLGLLCT